MNKFFLYIIIFVGLLVRLYDVPSNPPGFFVDEASIGYNAFSILKSGKDEYGENMPLFFRSTGDYKNPVFIYSATIPIILFGPSEFAVRLTSVIYGTLTLLALYLLTKRLFNKSIALWSTIFLSISPWHIHFSRVGFELIASLFWVTLGLYFLHKSLDHWKWYLLSLFSFMLAFFSYTTTKIYLPLILLIFFLVYDNVAQRLIKNKRIWVVTAVAFFLFFRLLWPYVVDGRFFSRWGQVKKKDLTISTLWEGYRNHFSPEFLFQKGDIDFPGQSVLRHSIKGVGELYWFQLPLILLGVLSIFFLKKYAYPTIFMMAFVALYPLGSIFTDTIPQATRSSIGIIPFQVLSGVGAYTLFSFFKKKVYRITVITFIIIITVISFISFIKLMKDYKFYAGNYWGWQYGFKQGMVGLKKEENFYDELLITHRFNFGEEVLRFYQLIIPCGKCQIMSNPIKIDDHKRQLFMLRPDDLKEAKELFPQKKFHLLKTINLPEGKPELFMGFFVER